MCFFCGLTSVMNNDGSLKFHDAQTEAKRCFSWLQNVCDSVCLFFFWIKPDGKIKPIVDKLRNGNTDMHPEALVKAFCFWMGQKAGAFSWTNSVQLFMQLTHENKIPEACRLPQPLSPSS